MSDRRRHRIEDRQRVRAVQRWLALPDDLDVFEFLGDQLKPRRPIGIEPLHLVARDRPVHATEHHVELAVAIDVGELRDVLTVGVNRDTLHILQRVGEGDETRRRARADVAVVADVAERRFRKQVDEPSPSTSTKRTTRRCRCPDSGWSLVASCEKPVEKSSSSPEFS